MPLEGARNPLDNEICPQFTKYLHEYDRTTLINFQRGTFGDWDQPLPLPRVRKLMGGLHSDKTIYLCLLNLIECPILNMCVLQAGS